MLANKRQFETGAVINYKSQGTTKIYCKFTAESACKRILKSVNIWLSYRQESWLPHALSVSGHCPAELARYLEYGKKQLLLTAVTLILT